MTVRFACGHRLDVDAMTDAAPPVCRVCGERRVAAVQAPPPRFVARDCGGRPMGPRVTHG